MCADLTADEIREYRGTLTEPGKEDPSVGRSVEENLALFEDMKNGKFEDGTKGTSRQGSICHPRISTCVIRSSTVLRI